MAATGRGKLPDSLDLLTSDNSTELLQVSQSTSSLRHCVETTFLLNFSSRLTSQSNHNTQIQFITGHQSARTRTANRNVLR